MRLLLACGRALVPVLVRHVRIPALLVPVQEGQRASPSARDGPAQQSPSGGLGDAVGPEVGRSSRRFREEGRLPRVAVDRQSRGTAPGPPPEPGPPADQRRAEDPHQSSDRPDARRRLLHPLRHDPREDRHRREAGNAATHCDERRPGHGDESSRSRAGSRRRSTRSIGADSDRGPLVPFPSSGGCAGQCHHRARRQEEPDRDQRQRQHGTHPRCSHRAFRFLIVRIGVLTIPRAGRGSKGVAHRASTVMRGCPGASARRPRGPDRQRGG